MPLLTSYVAQVPQATDFVQYYCTTPFYAIEIELSPAQKLWIVSHDAAIDEIPPTAVYLPNARLIDIPNINRNSAYLTGKLAISSPTFKIVDIGDELSQWIADKLINGFNTLGAIVSFWEWCGGEGYLYTPNVTATFQMQDHSRRVDGVVEIQTADINRGMSVELFNPLQWTLHSSISATDDKIPITLDPSKLAENERRFRHTDRYSRQPGEVVGYARFDSTDNGEIFSYKLMDVINGVTTLTGCERGLFYTSAVPVSVDPEQEPSQRPAITEVVHFSEEFSEIIFAIATGLTYDGRLFPWSAGIDSRWIDRQSFARYQQDMILEFTGIKPQSAKEFLEDNVLKISGYVLNINGRGQYELAPGGFPTDTVSGQQTFNETNTADSASLTLKHVKSNIHSEIDLYTNYSYTQEKFLSVTSYINLDANLKTKKVLRIEALGIHAGIHSGTQINRLAIALGDSVFGEHQELQVPSLINGIKPGARVVADFKNVINDADSSGSAVPLKKSMVVTAAVEDRKRRITTYTLDGMQTLASDYAAAQVDSTITKEEIKRGRINLATLPGITINAGIASGSITLTLDRHYYYVDDADPGVGIEFGPSLNVSFNGFGNIVGIWVYGPFVYSTTLDLSGRSKNAVGQGGTMSTLHTAGQGGELFDSTASGAVRATRRYRRFLNQSDSWVFETDGYDVRDRPPEVYTRGRHAAMPMYQLAGNNGQLTGWPGDLSGSSGPGAHTSRIHDSDQRPIDGGGDPPPGTPTTTWIDGGNGGLGGCGMLICSWGGGSSGSGRIITDGGGPQPEPVERWKTRAGPGMPGGLLWIVPGNHPEPLITSNNFHAYPGDASVTGEVISTKTDDHTAVRSTIAPTSRENLWQSAYRVIYTPVSENIQTPSGADIDLAVARQRDGRIQLIITSTTLPPSDGNPGDMAIAQALLDDTGNRRPYALIMSNSGVWEPIDWDTAPQDYHTLLFINREYGGDTTHYGSTRPVVFTDGDHWYNETTRVEWILFHPPQTDIMFRLDGVRVGDEMLSDPNFLLTAEGHQIYGFTNNAELRPVNVLQQALQDIADAFITSAITGDWEKGSTLPDIQLNPPSKIVFSNITDTAATVGWTAPLDTSNMTGYEIVREGAAAIVVNGIGTLSRTITGLSAGTTYVISVRSYSSVTNRRSIAISKNLTTTGAGGGFGITLATTGRYVSGTAQGATPGRQISLTLADGTQLLSSIQTASFFQFQVSSAQDNNNGQNASLYTNNGDSSSESQLTFTYTINQ